MSGKPFRHLLAVAAAFTMTAVMLPIPAFSQTAFTGTYTFSSTSGTANPFAYNGTPIANLTVGGLTRGSGITPSSSTGNFRSSNWTTTATLDANDYMEFTLTPAASYTLAMTSITFGIGNSTSGPKGWEWRSSMDSYASAITTYSATAAGLTIVGGTISSGSNSNWLNTTVNLSGGGFSNLTSAVTFRMYAYSAGASGGTGGFQTSVSFAGTMTAPLSGTFTWSGNGSTAGGTGTWTTTGANWSSTGTAPFSSAWNDSSQALFGTTGGTVTVDAGGITASRAIEFAVDGYTLTGGTLTFGGSNSAMTVAAASTTTINAPLAGPNGLSKFGDGTLVLGGVNTLSGPLAINAGTLQVAADSALGNSANDILLGGGTLKTTASIPMGSGRDFTGSGTLDIAPGTTLTSSGSVNLTATTLSNGGTLDLLGATRSLGNLAFGTAATVNGSGAISLNGLTATAVTSGSAIVNPAITFSSGDKTVDVGSGGTLVLNGDIAGTTGRIAKTGAGTLIASGSNTTSGYRVGAAGAAPTNGGTVILAAAAASGTGQLQLNYGTLDSTAPFTFANGLSVGGRVGAVAVLGGTNAMTFSGSSSFFRGSATSGELRLDVNNATTLAGVLGPTSGGGSATGVTIGGSGTLSFNGSAAGFVDTITLQDTVDLMINETLGGSVNVGAATLLGGTGTISGAVQVADNGYLAPGPGSSPGTLTINNVLTGTSISIFAFDLSATNQTVGGGVNDLVTGVTNLTLDGALFVNGIGDFTTVAEGTTWRLFNYSGTLTDLSLGFGPMPTLAAGRSFAIDTSTPGQVNLQVVPEPTTVALAGLGLAVAGWAARRRRRAG